MATKNVVQGESFYSASLLENLGLYLIGTLITVCTLGIGFPIAANLVLKYKNNKTQVSNNLIMFNGNVSALFKVYITSYAIVVGSLIVSAAIYMLWGKVGLSLMLVVVFVLALMGIVSFLNYVKEKSSFAKADGGSFFDGSTFQLFLLCIPAAICPVALVIVKNFINLPCVLNIVLTFVSIFVCVLIFVNSFIPWSVEHSMTSGKCYTFKGKVSGSLLGSLILSVAIYAAINVPSLVYVISKTMVSTVLYSILFFLVVAVIGIIGVYFIDVWTCANRFTVPENAKEVNNIFTKVSLALAAKIKSSKECFSNGDEKTRSVFSSFPTVLKIVICVLVAVLIAWLFYVIMY